MVITIISASLWFAAAMQSSTAMEQVSPSAGSAHVDAQDVLGRATPPLGGTDRVATDQLDGEGGSTPGVSQLTTEQYGREVDQPGRRDRNMQSSPDLSNRKQGFETRVVRLEGTDRCSAELLSARDREYCQKVIENRSAEYTVPKEVGLTPEQKLLSERNLRLLDSGTDGAIKRLAAGRNSAEDRDYQVIASIVLSSSGNDLPAQDQPAESKLSAETQALLDAIVKNVGGSPRP